MPNTDQRKVSVLGVDFTDSLSLMPLVPPHATGTHVSLDRLKP